MPPTVTYISKHLGRQSPLYLCLLFRFPVLYLGTFDKPSLAALSLDLASVITRNGLVTCFTPRGIKTLVPATLFKAVEDILDTDDYGIHVSGLRTHYESKAALVQEVLEAEGLTHKGWRWENPSGGLYFWLEGPEGLDTSIGSDFCEACLSSKVLYVPGDLCFAGGQPRNCVRLSFGVLLGDRLEEAVRRFARTAKAFSE